MNLRVNSKDPHTRIRSMSTQNEGVDLLSL